MHPAVDPDERRVAPFPAQLERLEQVEGDVEIADAAAVAELADPEDAFAQPLQGAVAAELARPVELVPVDVGLPSGGRLRGGARRGRLRAAEDAGAEDHDAGHGREA